MGRKSDALNLASLLVSTNGRSILVADKTRNHIRCVDVPSQTVLTIAHVTHPLGLAFNLTCAPPESEAFVATKDSVLCMHLPVGTASLEDSAVRAAAWSIGLAADRPDQQRTP